MKNLNKNIKLFILGTGVVLVWRGLWGLLDLYLLPNNQSLSFIISIIVGVVILCLNDNKLNELI